MSTHQIALQVGSSHRAAFGQVSAQYTPLLEGTVRAFLPALRSRSASFASGGSS
jgi:hypothetical protein